MYDPEMLRGAATRLLRRAGQVAVLYAALGFAIGAPLGGGAMVALNLARRVQECRTREDISEIIEDKRELLGRAPMGAGAAGVLLAALGFAFGMARATSLRAQAQTALCLAEIEARGRAKG